MRLECSQPETGSRAFEAGARSRARADRPDGLPLGVLVGREELLSGTNEGWEEFMSQNPAIITACWASSGSGSSFALGFAFKCTGEH